MTLEEYEKLLEDLTPKKEEKDNPFTNLVGKIVEEIIVADDNDRISFRCKDGNTLTFHHFQDCCESVLIEDIAGELKDLIGSPILMAEEKTSEYEPTENSWNDRGTWTFYKFATVKGYATIRWLGTSNGYYSESVDWFWE